jgi:hypothetical protein
VINNNTQGEQKITITQTQYMKRNSRHLEDTETDHEERSPKKQKLSIETISIHNLPPEILINICSYLHFEHIVHSVTLVHPTFYTLIYGIDHSEVLWSIICINQRIQLFVDQVNWNMIDSLKNMKLECLALCHGGSTAPNIDQVLDIIMKSVTDLKLENQLSLPKEFINYKSLTALYGRSLQINWLKQCFEDMGSKLKHLELYDLEYDFLKECISNVNNLETLIVQLEWDYKDIMQLVLNNRSTIKKLQIIDPVQRIYNEEILQCNNLKHLEVPELILGNDKDHTTLDTLSVLKCGFSTNNSLNSLLSSTLENLSKLHISFPHYIKIDPRVKCKLQLRKIHLDIDNICQLDFLEIVNSNIASVTITNISPESILGIPTKFRSLQKLLLFGDCSSIQLQSLLDQNTETLDTLWIDDAERFDLHKLQKLKKLGIIHLKRFTKFINSIHGAQYITCLLSLPFGYYTIIPGTVRRIKLYFEHNDATELYKAIVCCHFVEEVEIICNGINILKSLLPEFKIGMMDGIGRKAMNMLHHILSSQLNDPKLILNEQDKQQIIQDYNKLFTSYESFQRLVRFYPAIWALQNLLCSEYNEYYIQLIEAVEHEQLD